MNRILRPVAAGGVAAVVVLLAAAPGRTADPPPDWTGYTTVSDFVGEVVKADDKAVTVRITWYVTQSSGNNRPRLSANNRNFRNPFSHHHHNNSLLSLARASSGGSRPQIKEMHHDYELEYLPQSLVRAKALPAKLDDKGHKVPYTEKEREALRHPTSVPGYAADKKDVTPGTYVEVVLVRDRTISVTKATEDDLRIKYVYVLGHDPNPPKPDAGSAKKN